MLSIKHYYRVKSKAPNWDKMYVAHGSNWCKYPEMVNNSHESSENSQSDKKCENVKKQALHIIRKHKRHKLVR